MTEQRIQEIITYLNASRVMMVKGITEFPDNFQKEPTTMAIKFFSDTISLLEKIKTEPEHYADVKEENLIQF